MGVAIAASDAGTPLSVPVGQRLAPVGAGELIHNSGLGALPTAGTGTVSYTFNYTMPAAAAAGSAHTLYAVGAVGFNGKWAHAPNFTVTTRPAVPTSVTPSTITSSSVNLSWSGGGPQYRVVTKLGAVAPVTETDGTVLDLGAVTSTTVSGLNAGTQYSFAVYSKTSGLVFSSSAATTTATMLGAPPAPRYVNAATGVNTGTCALVANPCRTITYAMSQAATGSPGDAINVAPGTYNVALGEVFPIQLKSGVQLLATTTTPSAHIIDATGANARVFDTFGNASTVIEGFLITGGLHQPTADGSNAQAGAILIQGGAVNIRRNIFFDNESRGYSGVVGSFPSGGQAYGGAIVSSGASPTIENNLFHANTVRGGSGVSRFDGGAGGGGGNASGGAIWIFAGAATVRFNSFVANEAIGGNGGSSNAVGGGGGGIGFNGAMESSGAVLVSNLFANNTASGGTGGSGSPNGSNGLSFNGALNDNGGGNDRCLFFNNTAGDVGDTIGTNAVLADPQFHSSVDFRIRLSSPARGAGFSPGPAADLYGVARPSVPTIGAFEATGFTTTTGVASNANPAALAQSITFTATVTSPSGTPTGTVTFKDGATPICSSVALAATQAQCVTSSLSAGTHSITVEYAASGNFAASISTPLSQVVNPDPPRLGNISTRGQVLTGNDVMIGGFVIGGAANKTVVVRARGPSLVPFGITNALANPHLQLVRSSDQTTLVINDDWGSAPNAAAISASGFAPSNALESAILVNLPPGAYTAIMTGVGGGTGVGIVEVFELDHAEIPIANISTRGRVFTGNDVMIGGFVINGSASQTVVVRARGPSLVPFGITNALMNPQLLLVRSSDQSTVDSNDDWGTATNAAALSASGFAPSDSREAAVLITLPPGAYTVIVSGVGGSTGVAIVEVFAQ